MEQAVHSTDRRIAARVALAQPVSIVTTDGETRRAVTVNVSTSGMLVGGAGELPIWGEVTVDVPGVGLREARVVRRQDERYGLVFREPLSVDDFAAFTGIAPAAASPEPVPTDAAPAPAPRVAPHAFGRDRIKMFRRMAADWRGTGNA